MVFKKVLQNARKFPHSSCYVRSGLQNQIIKNQLLRCSALSPRGRGLFFDVVDFSAYFHGSFANSSKVLQTTLFFDLIAMAKISF